jgi:hypothetical protein
MRSFPFRSLLILAPFLLLLAEHAAFAFLYGAEFTFTKPALIGAANAMGPGVVDNPLSEPLRLAMVREVIERCPECGIKVFRDPKGLPVTRFTYPDGWWFQVALDPGVIEIQTRPSSYERFHEMIPRMQKDIFGAAAAEGVNMFPHQNTGDGHFHIDIEEAFEGNRLWFRNYLVDKMNHPELAKGVMQSGTYFHTLNAPPLAEVGEEAQGRFAQVIADFDADPSMTIKDLIKNVNEKVYTETHPGATSVRSDFPRKYQAVNLQHEETVELRYPRPQKSAEDFVRMIGYEEARIKYIRKIAHPIPFVHQPRNLTRQELVDRFHKTVLENEQDWNEAKKILPEDLASFTPTEVVEAPVECVTRAFAGHGH